MIVRSEVVGIMNGITQFANIGQIHLSFFMKKSQQFFHLFAYNPGGIRKIRIIHSHVGLYQ